jgi:hypothetical protein
MLKTGRYKIMDLITQNSKMAKSGDGRYNFGIEASKRNCPNAGICKKFCYAQKGTFRFPCVGKAYTKRGDVTRQADFEDLMSKEIQRKRTLKNLRLHDSGDMYSLGYIRKWFRIMSKFPDIKFYAYTKMVLTFNYLKKEIPSNFTLIYSEGGKQDKFIKPTDRQARIFETEEAIETAGYANASHDDAVAQFSTNNKIGLVIH